MEASYHGSIARNEDNDKQLRNGRRTLELGNEERIPNFTFESIDGSDSSKTEIQPAEVKVEARQVDQSYQMLNWRFRNSTISIL